MCHAHEELTLLTAMEMSEKKVEKKILYSQELLDLSARGVDEESMLLEGEVTIRPTIPPTTSSPWPRSWTEYSKEWKMGRLKKKAAA